MHGGRRWMPGERLGSLLVGPSASGGGDSGRARPAPGRSQIGFPGLSPAAAAAQVRWDGRMCGWPLLVLWALLPATAAGSSGRSYPHRVVLDPEGKYWLHWGRQGERLAFRLEVRTTGYVGFGFSPTGSMAAADIVVGGVANGRPYLQVSLGPEGIPVLGSPQERDGQRSPPKNARLTPVRAAEPFSPSLPSFAPGSSEPALWSLPMSFAVFTRGSFPPRKARILVLCLTDLHAHTGHTFPSTSQEKKKDHNFEDLTGQICLEGQGALACLRLGFAESWFWKHPRSRANI